MISANVRTCSFRKNGDDAPEEPPSYLAQMRIMRTDDRTTLYVDFADVLAYSSDLAEQIVSEYYRFDSGREGS